MEVSFPTPWTLKIALWIFFHRCNRNWAPLYSALIISFKPNVTVSEPGLVWLIMKASSSSDPPWRTGASRLSIHPIPVDMNKSCRLQIVLFQAERMCRKPLHHGSCSLRKMGYKMGSFSPVKKTGIRNGTWALNLQFQYWPMTEISPPFCRRKINWRKGTEESREVRGDGNCCISELWLRNLKRLQQTVTQHHPSVHMHTQVPGERFFQMWGSFLTSYRLKH